MSPGRPLAGGILWTVRDGDVQLALAGAADRLPRGEVRPGEHPVSRAYAEVTALGGQGPAIGARLAKQRRNGNRIDYWEMQALGASPRLRWFSLAEVPARLSDPADRKAVREFRSTSRPDSTVLVVRHGLAGRKSRWDGPDDQRPLDTVGIAQARGLRDMLQYWIPRRIISAEKLRCVQTVEPLAKVLGLPVEREMVLTEDCNSDGSFPGIARIEEIATQESQGARTVVCSQGGVIPAAIEALHVAAGLPVPAIRAKKGSTWALQFASGRLIHADYYSDFAASKA